MGVAADEAVSDIEHGLDLADQHCTGQAKVRQVV
jgi:hypothetical protein